MTDAELVREIARPLSGDGNDYDNVLELIGNARFVLLGEATHGTHEFYSERAAITKRLIAEKGSQSYALRRIGRIHLTYTVTCAARRQTLTQTRRFWAFADFQRSYSCSRFCSKEKIRDSSQRSE